MDLDKPGDAHRRRRVTVMGLGLFGGGLAVTKYLTSLGADVLVTDLRDASLLTEPLAALAGLPIRYRLGEHRTEDFTAAELVVANPAVAPNSPYLEAARRAGVKITSEFELFIRACPSREMYAVTGTNGKTTTTALLGSMLASVRPRTLVGGNIGRSLLECLDTIAPSDAVVLEVSSYQLESLDPPRPWPRVAVVTNLSPDHLERHGTMQQYAAAKRRIVECQDAACDAIVNISDPYVREFANATPARIRGFSRSDPAANYTVAPCQGAPWFVERLDGRETPIVPVSSLAIPGSFQQDNALAAIAAARVAGLDAATIASALSAFRGVKHRLQALTPVRGVKVFDNAVSTVPESTASALETMARGVLWIAGGKSKNLDLAGLARTAAAREARVFVYGAARSELASALGGAGPCAAFETLAAAFAAAIAEARPGDTLLYSPAFPSFDQYRNFTERGAEFLALVERWRCASADPALEA